MSEAHQKSYAELVSLFADASNAMHVSLDIPSIMRVAIASAMRLVDAKDGAAGLMIDEELAFSEYSNGETWQPMQLRLGSDVSWVSDIYSNKKPLLMNEVEDFSCFDQQSDAELAEAKQLIALPVIGKEHDLLACLLLFEHRDSRFSEGDVLLLEQLSSMVSVAIENSIQLSESRRVEEDLEKSVATYRTLVEQIPAITYIATLDRSRILFVSPQVEGILGYSQEDFLANQETWSQQIHHEDRDRVLSEVRESLEESIPFHSEYRIASKDGRHIWVKDAASKVHDHDQDLYLQGVVHDISERKESEEKLMKMAHFDQLTGLANRVLFHDRLDRTVAQARRHQQKFAVLYMDLDGFKAVNDTLGHQVGDQLLSEAAGRLKANVREIDTVARMGGDEFTIILNEVNCSDSVKVVAEKLIDAISDPYESICPDHKVTLSIGVAFYPDDSSHRDALITAADNAMYRAKNSGKNCCCFHLSDD